VALATFVRLQLLVGGVKVNPNLNAGPGGPTIEKLLDWLAGLMLVACAAGALYGVGQWVLGSHSSRASQVDSGKTKVGIGLGGAFIIGALPALIDFFLSTGGTVHK
jgi:hypothetical protein